METDVIHTIHRPHPPLRPQQLIAFILVARSVCFLQPLWLIQDRNVNRPPVPVAARSEA